MELTRQTFDDVLVVKVCEDRIDAVVAIQFKDALREAATDAPSRIVLDLSQVAFMDSSGLGAVIGVMKQLAPTRKLELAALSTAVEKVFRLTRMDKVFAIHDSPQEAIEVRADAG